MPSAPIVATELNCQHCGWPLIKDGKFKCHRCKQEVQATLGQKAIFCSRCRNPKMLFAKHDLALCHKCRQETLMRKEKETVEINYQTEFTTSTTPEGIEEAIRTLKVVERKMKTKIKKMNSVFDAEMKVRGLKNREPVRLKEVFPEEIPVRFNLGYAIEKIAVLREVRNYGGDDKILIQKEGFSYISPRGKYCGAICDSSSAGELSATLWIVVLRDDRRWKYPLLDRGVCWVAKGDLGMPGTVSLNLQNIDKHLAQGEIAGILKKVKEKVDQVLDEVFKLSQSTKI